MSVLLTRIKHLWLAVFLVLAVGYVVYYLRNEFVQSGATLRLAPAWLVSAGLFHAAFLFVASANWSRIVQSSTGLSLSLYESFRQLAIVSLGKYLPGKVWGAIARGAVLARRGVHAREAVLATFHEQYLLVVSGVAILALCLVPVLDASLAWLAGLGCGAVVVLGYYAQAWGLRLIRRFASRRDDDHDHWRVGLPWESYTRLIARFLILWILNGLIFASLYYAMFAGPISVERISTLTLANAAGIMAGFFALFAPGGIGVREAASSAILASVMPLADALMLGAVFRVWVTVIELISSLTVVSELRWHHGPARP